MGDQKMEEDREPLAVVDVVKGRSSKDIPLLAEQDRPSSLFQKDSPSEQLLRQLCLLELSKNIQPPIQKLTRESVIINGEQYPWK